MRFILDNNLAPNLSRAIGLLVEPYGDVVKCLKDLGLHDKEDEEWIPKLAADGGWIIITCDLDIVRNPHRQLVFRQAQLTAFFLLSAWSGGAVRGPQIAQRLLALWPEITDKAAKASPGTCFAVRFRGGIYRFSPQGKKPI